MSKYLLLLIMCTAQLGRLMGHKLTYQLTFPPTETDSYAKLDGTIQQVLTQFTLCYWSKYTNHRTSPHLISYVIDQPSADYIRIYTSINGNVIYLSGSGGNYAAVQHYNSVWQWIHVCVSWAEIGPWVVYINGKSLQIGTAGHKRSIYPYGVVVLGKQVSSFEQEFQQLNPFKGHITELHMWDYVLTSEEISRVHTCSFKKDGNVISWNRDSWTLFGGTRISHIELPCG